MKKFLSHNIGLKIISLLLAVVSWYAIRETISFEVLIPDIPLEIKVAEGWAVLNQSEDSLRVTFRGSQEDMRLLDREQIKAVINLEINSVAGVCEVVVRSGDIKGIIRGARVLRVEPNRVKIRLDREAEKQVSVKSRATGKPFYGKVEKLICEPAVVLLHGPAKQLERINWVYTQPVDVDKRVESFTKRRRVLPPSKMQTYRIEPEDVTVKVVITEESENLEWKNMSVSAVVKPDSNIKVEITPAKVNVILTGRAETLESLKAMSPKVFVDCTDLDPSVTYDLPVSIYMPLGKEISAVAEPAFVHIVIGKL